MSLVCCFIFLSIQFCFHFHLGLYNLVTSLLYLFSPLFSFFISISSTRVAKTSSACHFPMHNFQWNFFFLLDFSYFGFALIVAANPTNNNTIFLLLLFFFSFFLFSCCVAYLHCYQVST